jgi:flavodoxin
MKALVMYYSKSGNTKKAAQAISNNLKTDLDEIIDFTDRNGFLNWFRAGRDGMKKRLTKIKYTRDPKKYDLVIIGTPVWGWNMVPAVRTFLTENRNKIKKVAFFSTSGGSNVEPTFADMKSLSAPPIALLSITDKEIKSNNYSKKISEFCNKIKKE